MSGWYKIKRRASDIIFSEFIRRRDKKCMYRFKCLGLPCDWKYDLDCSHWQGRGKEGTRVDEDNADACCRKCHKYVTDTAEGKKALDKFKLKQLGQVRHDMVLLRANSYHKKDEFMSKLIARELLKSLEHDK